MIQPEFPTDLLEKPTEDRKKYFEGYIILHPKLETAFNRVKQAITGSGEESIIMLYGPSGVGKTTLSKKIINIINGQSSDSSTIPAVRVRAPAPDKGSFDWDLLYKRVLIAMDDPSIKYKHTSKELKSNMEDALYYRKTRVVIIDEAQHIGKVIGARKLEDQLDIIKELVNDKSIIFALLGTYQLLPFVELGDQLSQRSIPIHFPRYRANVGKKEIKIFRQALFSFQSHLPLKVTPDLDKDWEFLYKRTIGCIGTLKKLLNRSLTLCLENNESTMTIEHLKSCALLPEQVYNMYVEAHEGELQAERYETAEEKLNTVLKYRSESDMLNKNQEKGTEKKKGKRVGRNPARDPIGDLKNA